MYNGIGLQTPRGSGTSGYIQRNLSVVKKNIKTREEFLKELQQLKVCIELVFVLSEFFKENILKPQRKANPEILKHQQKKQIQLKLLEMREKLESQGFNSKWERFYV